jgi:hypothetical protein
MRKAPTGQAAVLQLEAEAAAYGFRKIQDGQGKCRFVVTCTDCGREASVFHSALRDERQLLAHFVRNGWMFARKESQFCSTQCARSAKEKRQARERAEREEEMMKPTPAPTPAPAPAHAPVSTIGPDPKITRRVIVALEEHFDDEKKLYRPGWDDQRIAEETKAALDFVKKYRKDAYGELAEDPEIAKLRDDIKAMEDLFANQLSLFSTQLKDLERSFAHQIAELKHRAERLNRAHPKAAG